MNLMWNISVVIIYYGIFASFNINCKIPIASVSSCFPLCYGRHRPIRIFAKSQLVINTVAFDLKHMSLAS